MARLLKIFMNDTSAPDRGGGPAGTNFDDEFDDSFNVTAQVGDFGGINNGNQESPDGNWSKIWTAAGLPAEIDSSGENTKGLSQWKWGDNGMGCGHNPGWNETDPGFQTQFYFRCYLRFESGFEWNDGADPGYLKLCYWNQLNGDRAIIFGIYGTAGDGNKAWGLHIFKHDDGSPNDSNHGANLSWYQSQGNSFTGSGQWNCYEWFVKMNSNPSTADGQFKFWFNGTQYADYDDLSFWTQDGGWSWCQMPNNQNLVTPSGTSWRLDVAAIEADSDTYIGPLSGGSTSRAGSIMSLRY